MLDFNLELDNLDGEHVVFTDTSTDIVYTDIVAVRFLFGNNLEQEQELSSGDLSQYRKYIKTAGSPSVYDNKTESIGSIYIPFVDVSINGGDTWEYLRMYSPPATYTVATASDVLIENSDGSFTAVASPPLYVLPDTTYNFYVGSNPVVTATVPTLKDTTFNIVWTP